MAEDFQQETALMLEAVILQETHIQAVDTQEKSYMPEMESVAMEIIEALCHTAKLRRNLIV